MSDISPKSGQTKDDPLKVQVHKDRVSGDLQDLDSMLSGVNEYKRMIREGRSSELHGVTTRGRRDSESTEKTAATAKELFNRLAGYNEATLAEALHSMPETFQQLLSKITAEL